VEAVSLETKSNQVGDVAFVVDHQDAGAARGNWRLVLPKAIWNGRGGHWQAEAEAAPAPELALDPDSTAVYLEDALGDGQPEPGPTGLARR